MIFNNCPFYGCCPGGLSPIKATDAMTNPVGQKDGQLYTAPSGMPTVSTTDNGKITRVVNGAWAVVADLTNDEATITNHTSTLASQLARIVALETKMDDIYEDLGELVLVMDDIVAGAVDNGNS